VISRGFPLKNGQEHLFLLKTAFQRVILFFFFLYKSIEVSLLSDPDFFLVPFTSNPPVPPKSSLAFPLLIIMAFPQCEL